MWSRTHRKFHFWLGLVTLAALLVAVVPMALAGEQSPQTVTAQGAVKQGALEVKYPVRMDTSAPLAKMKPLPVSDEVSPTREILQRVRTQPLPKAVNAAGKTGKTDPAVVQTDFGSNAPVGANIPAPLTSFDGVGNVNGVLPPDTNGDIGYDPDTGTKYYFQTVNLSFQIWDVTDPANPVSVYGPAANNTMWSGFGGICETNNDGDPIVLYDHLANRWLFTQFALDFPDNFHQCIAVSATADPTGPWYRYDFLVSTTKMNDYPHFGVWRDAYYMAANQFDGATFAWAGQGVWAFERDAMLQGVTARMIYFDVGAVTLDYGGMLPADLDGPAPPPGTPGYFVEWDDSTWLGDPSDMLRIWEFVVDWNDPTLSTFGANANFDPNYLVPTADVDPNMCNFSRNCIPQPGGTALDAISDRIMHRLVFRMWGPNDYSLISNHTVDATGGDVAGIHWFELGWDGTTWSMYQEGVYAPADGENRWMASIAADKDRNMALGFSLSSTSTYPSVHYTGRLAGDPLGSMPQGEEIIVTGGGSQGHSSGRWGDYSMMAVDPTDDCTFWYTQEYYAADSSANWSTRIGAFVFPSCTAAAKGTLTGTVTDAATTDPIADARVEIVEIGYVTFTDVNGQYTFVNVPVGTYTVTVSAYGYTSDTATGVVVTDGATTTQDFQLNALPSYQVTFDVFDANTLWPLYARIDIQGAPFSPVYTDPASGQVTVTLPEGTHTVTVSALTGGYIDITDIQVINADVIWVFPMDVDLTACNAPGYAFTFGFWEDFDGGGGFPPAGWTVVDNAGSGLVWDTNAAHGLGNFTGGSGLAATVNSDANWFVPYDTELITPTIDPTTLPGLVLTYLANYQDLVAGGDDRLDLDVSLDGGTTWINILSWDEDHGTLGSTPGEQVFVDLAPIVGTTPFMLRWHYYTPDPAPWDWYAQIDEVAIGECLPIADGLIYGTVYDANTSAALADATVEVQGGDVAVMVDARRDPNTPDYLYFVGALAGDHTVTASAFGYNSDSATVTVVAQGAVQQDFYLTAPRLTLDPTQQEFTVYPTAPTTSGSALLNNTGSADADYKVYPVRGPVPSFTPLSIEDIEEALRLDEPRSKEEERALVSTNALGLGPLAATDVAGSVSLTAAGDVVAQWAPTGMTYAWGLGVDRSAGTIWVGDLSVAGAPSDTNYEFLPDGTPTGNSIDLSWVGVFAADMAYNPFTGTLWQINVGGDYCIYELDPVNLMSTGRRVCPSIQLSLRGLAFDPLTNTFIAGTWNYDGYVFRIGMNGDIYAMKKVGLPISGLAFNPSTGHLFALVNADTSGATGAFDIFILDVNNDFAILNAFNIGGTVPSVMDPGGQAGLGFSCDGTLWAVDQGAQMVYGFDSGETGWCDFLAPWLTVTPDTNLLSAGNSETLALDIDMTGLPAGTYDAHLVAVTLSPYADPMSGVRVNVLPDNDDVGSPVALGVPSSTTLDTTPYTFISSDPVPSCAPGRLGATAWYTITTTTDRFVAVDTFLSDYDTVIALFSGTPGSFLEEACSDDVGGAQSQFLFSATAGTTYYLMVGAKNEGAGGNLHLHVTSFADVPGTYWAWDFVEGLVQSGVTSGYGNGNYGPGDLVTRAQMAVFMLRAKHGAGYTPPAFSSYSFPDIATSWAADWIEQAFQEGIVSGYNDGTYRPNEPVTRAQMAVFILRTVEGAGYTPPAYSSYSFPDIATNWAADWIEEIYQRGIVSGYNDGTYRPNEYVTRAQMAKFIVNAFNLPTPGLTP